MRRVLCVLALLLAPVVVAGQATHITTSGTLPANCRVGDIYQKTGANAGLYRCSATNTWTIDSPGTASADGVPVGDGTVFTTRTLPSCSNSTTSKLLYDSSTDTFSCGTDQGTSGTLGGASFVVKTMDESVSNSTALQSDDELVFGIGANETWLVEFFILNTGSTTGDFQACVNVPSGATGYWAVQSALVTTATANNALNVQAWTTDLSDTCAFAVGTVTGVQTVNTWRAYVVNSSNAGSITLRWAQLSTNGTATVVEAGSYLMATRIQ